MERGRKLVCFAGCDYFRLSSHPEVLRALRDGLRKYGLNVAASRLTTGNHPLYEKLEQSLANFFRVQSALLAPNGWTPNSMVTQALAGQFSHALLDECAHGSLVDAARFLDCPVLRFPHRDAPGLAQVIQRLGDIRPLVLTDGMFSHDGSVAPLAEYLAVLPRGGTLLVDDAHGAGLLGRTGRGTPQLAGLPPGRVIQTITLSKAFGVFGGAVLGTRKLRAAILSRSSIFTGSTPLPLPLVNAALKSIAVLKSNPSPRHRLARNVARVRCQLRGAGIAAPGKPGPILQFVPQSPAQTARVAKDLRSAGIHPPLIHYPGGPENGYFRFAISSEHAGGQLDRLAKVLIRAHRASK
jgi:8-amino-7-oxononanoate synthase